MPISRAAEELRRFVRGETKMRVHIPGQPAKEMDVSEMIKAGFDHVLRMTPEERAEMHRLQRESWVRGEMAMGSDADEARDREKGEE